MSHTDTGISICANRSTRIDGPHSSRPAPAVAVPSPTPPDMITDDDSLTSYALLGSGDEALHPSTPTSAAPFTPISPLESSQPEPEPPSPAASPLSYEAARAPAPPTLPPFHDPSAAPSTSTSAAASSPPGSPRAVMASSLLEAAPTSTHNRNSTNENDNDEDDDRIGNRGPPRASVERALGEEVADDRLDLVLRRLQVLVIEQSKRAQDVLGSAGASLFYGSHSNMFLSTGL